MKTLLKRLKKLKNQIFSIGRFVWSKEIYELTRVTEKEYQEELFGKLSFGQLTKAYEKAWEAKNFEIENYWKRTNYFWAFQVASFAGYFSVLGTDFYTKSPEVLYYVICIGFVTALAWAFINIGSKTWQRHWEIHVDLLEEKITGPLYKIVTANKTFSVSKINEIVSRFFTAIWLLIGLKFLFEKYNNKFTGWGNIQYDIVFCTLIVIYFSVAMYHGHGRGRFGKRQIKLYKRDFEVGT